MGAEEIHSSIITKNRDTNEKDVTTAKQRSKINSSSKYGLVKKTGSSVMVSKISLNLCSSIDDKPILSLNHISNNNCKNQNSTINNSSVNKISNNSVSNIPKRLDHSLSSVKSKSKELPKRPSPFKQNVSPNHENKNKSKDILCKKSATSIPCNTEMNNVSTAVNRSSGKLTKKGPSGATAVDNVLTNKRNALTRGTTKSPFGTTSAVTTKASGTTNTSSTKLPRGRSPGANGIPVIRSSPCSKTQKSFSANTSTG